MMPRTISNKILPDSIKTFHIFPQTEQFRQKTLISVFFQTEQFGIKRD